MTEFIEALVDLLPEHNSLKDTGNELRNVLDKSAGEWFDNIAINGFYDNLFINTATGGFLDLFGKDYGVTRQKDETDDVYRERIIQEKNDRLTPNYLNELYSLTVYAYVSQFNPTNNTLTSDNQYINQNGYMACNTNDINSILDKKFIMGESIVWIGEEED